MNKEEKISFLENAFGLFEGAEAKIKEFNLKISKLNDDIKQLRALRDALKIEKDSLLEECKNKAIDLEVLNNEITT